MSTEYQKQRPNKTPKFPEINPDMIAYQNEDHGDSILRRRIEENELEDVYPKLDHGNVTLDDDISNEHDKQRTKDATDVLKFLQSIGAAGHHTIWKAMARNLPDIKKYHEWHQNKDKSVSVDWYDLKGKSIPHLKWDYNYWNNVANGYNNNNKAYDDAAKWYLYHENKLVNYKTDPKNHAEGIGDQETAMEHYWHLMDANKDPSLDSWIQKIHNDKFWMQYHQNKINNWGGGTYNIKKGDSVYKIAHGNMALVDQIIKVNHLKYPYIIYPNQKLVLPGMQGYSKRVNRQIKLYNQCKKNLSIDTQRQKAAIQHAQIYLRAVQQRIQAQRDAEIAQKVKINDENHLTSIYRADRQDTTVIGVAEMSPTEEMSMDLPTKAIDKQMPEGDYANLSEEQLSGTYYIFVQAGSGYLGGYAEDTSPSLRNRVNQFKVLRSWAKDNHRVVVKGFTWWSSTMIQSVSRTMDANGAANTLELQITFQYQRVAKIAMAKQKAPTGKRKGRNRKKGKNQSHSYKVKPGDSIYKIAHGNMRQVHSIEHANPKLRNPNLIYPGNKLVIPK